MATIKEEFESLKIRINKGEGGKVIHVVDHDAERKRKLQNPQKSTRVILDCRTADGYKEFQAQKERFFELAVDPHIAVSLITRALKEVPDEQIRQWLNEGQEEPPEWLR